MMHMMNSGVTAPRRAYTGTRSFGFAPNAVIVAFH